MSLDQRMHSVIRSLYDAAMDEALWPAALAELTAITGSQAATFWTLDGSDEPRLPILTTYNFDPAFMKEYLDGMVPLDPTVQYLVRHPETPIVHDGLVITERDKERSAYYDWHHRHSDTRFRMVGQTQPAGGVQAGVALHRTRRTGRYEAQDLERFDFLYQHLARALKIGFRLGSLGSVTQCTMELLDRNPAAIVLLDETSRLVYANRAAEVFRLKGDGVRLTSNGLVFEHQQDQVKLEHLIRCVLSAVSAQGISGGVIRAGRPSGKQPYVVLVAPMAGRYPALSTLRPAVCIVVTDPETKPLLPNHRLRGAFGLTQAEARLAARLATGEPLREAAASLGITYGTARVRLAEIFHKTGVRRQSELVRLLLSTLSAL